MARYDRAATVALESRPVRPGVAETLAAQPYGDDLQRKGIRKPRPFTYESDPRLAINLSIEDATTDSASAGPTRRGI